jgi:hypothetical protein
MGSSYDHKNYAGYGEAGRQNKEAKWQRQNLKGRSRIAT